ncbi:major facilitator superfamily domain-containing protein [Schizophyllum amplum]|uniref:Major facilitator superfamily domain-containing protein n=1 Tax=Schizophyllum amplum TaxID=97359 RepID=A0A550C2Q0_9AGAR|nr:major facilitator superfamily domain-containing protein [Auriculariopsis ampla]
MTMLTPETRTVDAAVARRAPSAAPAGDEHPYDRDVFEEDGDDVGTAVPTPIGSPELLQCELPSLEIPSARRPSAIRQETDATLVWRVDKEAKLLDKEVDVTSKEVETLPKDVEALGGKGIATPPYPLSRASTLVVPEAATGGWRDPQWRAQQINLFTVCYTLYVCGWNDGSTGPLLPRMQADYNIGFSTVALIFVVSCLGFVSGGFLNVKLDQKFGFGKTIVFGAIFQLMGYVLMAPHPPFPGIVVAYGLTGFGMSYMNAQGNGFTSRLPNAPTKLGFLHASYGLGAFTAPFSATYFSTAPNWTYHYFVSISFAAINIVLLAVVFRGRRQEVIMEKAGLGNPDDGTEVPSGSLFRQILRIRTVWLLAAFALIYIGVEVTLGGWIVTFIINVRGGDLDDSGYISSGFFGGLMLGRLCLLWLNKLVGPKRVIFLYAFMAIALELTVWFVPSRIENATAVSIIGMLLGPMFPIIVGHSSNVFPKHLLTPCVGFITAIGVSGSAVLPVITGLLANNYGIESLQPLMVAMMATMVILWALVVHMPGQAN